MKHQRRGERETRSWFGRLANGKPLACVRLDAHAIMDLRAGGGVLVELPLSETGEATVLALIVSPLVDDAALGEMMEAVRTNPLQIPLRRVGEEGNP